MAIAMCVDDYLLGLEDPTLSADLDSYIEVLEVYEGKRQLGVEHYQLGCLIGGKVCSTDPSNWAIGLEEAGDNIFVRFWNWLKALFTKFWNWIKSLFSSKNGETNAFSKPAAYLPSRCDKISAMLIEAKDQEIKVDFSKSKEKYLNFRFIESYLGSDVAKVINTEVFGDYDKHAVALAKISQQITSASNKSDELAATLWSDIVKLAQEGKKEFVEKLPNLKKIDKFLNLGALDQTNFFSGTVAIKTAGNTDSEFEKILAKVKDASRSNEYGELSKKCLKSADTARVLADATHSIHHDPADDIGKKAKSKSPSQATALRAYMDYANTFVQTVQKYAGAIRKTDASVLRTINFIGKSVSATVGAKAKEDKAAVNGEKKTKQPKKNKKAGKPNAV